MKKNKIILVLASTLSILFLAYIVSLTNSISQNEQSLIDSPNVIDASDLILTKLKVSKNEFKNDDWVQQGFNDSDWKEVKIPANRIVQEKEYGDSVYGYYRIFVPQKAFSKLPRLKNEISIALFYIQFSKLDIYLNGHFYRSNSPKDYNESVVILPLDDSRDNIISIKGYIKSGDTGINHRMKILIGKGAELNEVHRSSYKGQTVYSLIFLLSKGSIFLVFALIYLITNVNPFFEKSLLFSLFVILEDILMGDYLTSFLTLPYLIGLYNLANVGITFFCRCF